MTTPSIDLPITEQVRHRVDERGVAWITLNRPDVKNAISPDQRDRVIALLAEASADLHVRAVVLGAEGDAFCTGADLRAPRPPAPRPDDAPKRATGEVAKMIREGAQALIAAVPRRGHAPLDASFSPGELPSPIDPPAGCHFHPRCPSAGPRCRREAPLLVETAPTHRAACHLHAGGVQ